MDSLHNYMSEDVVKGEGNEVFTSALPVLNTPRAKFTPAPSSLEPVEMDIKTHMLVACTESWISVLAGIESMPAHSLEYFVRSFEKIAQLYEHKTPVEKSIIKVLFNAHIPRVVDSHWAGIILYLVTRLIDDHRSADELISQILRHYLVAELAHTSRQKVIRIVPDFSLFSCNIDISH